MTSESRYLSDAALHEFIKSGPTTAVRLSGIPETQLVFLPGSDGGVALRVEWDGTGVPDLSEYEHLSTEVVRTGKNAWSEFLVDDPDVFLRALPVVWRIADRIQLEQFRFSEAVIATLADFSELLEDATGLSAEIEVGLFGELTVLDCLISGIGGTGAISAWRGPSHAEHDFDLGSGDVEVKTTTSEKRVHWIGSASQLEPTPGRMLWLLSLQLTTGVSEATTISDLIAKVRWRIQEPDRDAFEKKLRAAGWQERHSAKVRRRFRLRSTPLLLPIDADFPALTRHRLAAAGMPLARLQDLRYSIDVAGLAQEQQPPEAFGQLLTEGEIGE